MMADVFYLSDRLGMMRSRDGAKAVPIAEPGEIQWSEAGDPTIWEIGKGWCFLEGNRHERRKKAAMRNSFQNSSC